MSYGILDNIIEDLENLMEHLIEAAEALLDYLCPFCHGQHVHRLFRENPDGSYDEVGLKCVKCKKML
jgi:hypothetical protein